MISWRKVNRITVVVQAVTWCSSSLTFLVEFVYCKLRFAQIVSLRVSLPLFYLYVKFQVEIQYACRMIFPDKNMSVLPFSVDPVPSKIFVKSSDLDDESCQVCFTDEKNYTQLSVSRPPGLVLGHHLQLLINL